MSCAGRDSGDVLLAPKFVVGDFDAEVAEAAGTAVAWPPTASELAPAGVSGAAVLAC